MIKKNVIIAIGILCLIAVFGFICIANQRTKNKGISLFYKQDEYVLVVANMDSGKYISKIEINTQADTLIINVYKKLIISPGCIKKSALTYWKIRLNPIYHYVKYGEDVISIRSIKEPLKDMYPAIEIFPEKFPYIAE